MKLNNAHIKSLLHKYSLMNTNRLGWALSSSLERTRWKLSTPLFVCGGLQCTLKTLAHTMFNQNLRTV